LIFPKHSLRNNLQGKEEYRLVTACRIQAVFIKPNLNNKISPITTKLSIENNAITNQNICSKNNTMGVNM